MRKLILLFICLSLHTISYNQVIKGTVLEKKTNEVVMFAAVYFNGTLVGTSSDEYGNFEIDISKYPRLPLTISAIGYHSIAVNDFSPNKPLIVHLKPKVFKLDEVVIVNKSLVRRRKANLKIFKTVFIGKSSNSKKCKITNENAIIFDYSCDKDTVKAKASQPIFIINYALGYKITYYLERFEFHKNDSSFIFSGNIIFSILPLTKDLNNNSLNKKRRKAYLGSRMHFLRSLWSNKLDDEGFYISHLNKPFKYKNLVTELDNHQKAIKRINHLDIEYRSALSYISVFNENVRFYKNGYIDPIGIFWGDDIARRRIGDWLPLDYQMTL